MKATYLLIISLLGGSLGIQLHYVGATMDDPGFWMVMATVWAMCAISFRAGDDL